VADCVEAYAQKPWFLQFMDNGKADASKLFADADTQILI